MQIIKTNNLQEGDCVLQQQFGIYVDNNKRHTYLCCGNTFDEAIEYFMKHWGNNPRYKPMHTIEVFYNCITKDNLTALALCC